MANMLHLVLAFVLVLSGGATPVATTDLGQTLAAIEPATLIQQLTTVPFTAGELPDGFFSWQRQTNDASLDNAAVSTVYKFIPPGELPATPAAPGVKTGNKMVQYVIGYVVFSTPADAKHAAGETRARLSGPGRWAEPLAFDEWGVTGVIITQTSDETANAVVTSLMAGNVLITVIAIVNTMPVTTALTTSVIDLSAAAIAHLASVATARAAGT